MFEACRSCHCTNLQPCEGGCSWVEDDLCSECATGVVEVSAEEPSVIALRAANRRRAADADSIEHRRFPVTDDRTHPETRRTG